MGGVKKNIFLIDLPKDLEVTLNGEPLEIKDQKVGSAESGNVKTIYYYPGVRLKLKKNTSLKLKSGEQTAVSPVNVVYRPGDIAIATIGNIFLTLGAGLIVDIADGALKTPKERFIDVPALLEHRTPRNQKELHKITLGKK